MRVFVLFAQADEAMERSLERALAMLRRTNVIELSSSRDAGMLEAMERADLVLVLMSPDYLADDYCFDVELERARALREAGRADVMVVLLRETEISTRAEFKRFASGERVEAWFEKLTRLPYASGRDQNGKPTGVDRDGRPVTRWANADDAWTEIAREIRDAIEARRARLTE